MPKSKASKWIQDLAAKHRVDPDDLEFGMNHPNIDVKADIAAGKAGVDTPEGIKAATGTPSAATASVAPARETRQGDERFRGKSVEEITDILSNEYGDHMIAQKEAELIYLKLTGKLPGEQYASKGRSVSSGSPTKVSDASSSPSAPADGTSGAVPGADRFQMNSAVKAEYEKLIKEQPLSWQNDASVQRDAYDEAMLIVRSKGGSVFSGSPTKVSDASSSPSAPADGTSGAAATGSSGSASGAAETGSSGTPSAATASVAPAPAQPERTTRSLSQSESTLKIGGMPAVEGQPLAPEQISAIDLALGMNPANAKNYPAWVLDQYAKQKRKEGTPDKGMGDQTKPDLGTGGEDASGGGGGGDPTGKSETEAGAPGGTPEPIQSAPPNVPADLVPPSQQNQDNTPIVMNNNSSSSSGSISGGAADKVSGQNLPMNAQNASLTEYFAKQNINYQ